MSISLTYLVEELEGPSRDGLPACFMRLTWREEGGGAMAIAHNKVSTFEKAVEKKKIDAELRYYWSTRYKTEM